MSAQTAPGQSVSSQCFLPRTLFCKAGGPCGFLGADELRAGDRLLGIDGDVAVVSRVDVIPERLFDVVTLRTRSTILEVTADHRLIMEAPAQGTAGSRLHEVARRLVGASHRRVLLSEGFEACTASLDTRRTSVIRAEFENDGVALAMRMPVTSVAVLGARRSASCTLQPECKNGFLHIAEPDETTGRHAGSCPPSCSHADWYERKACLSIGAVDHAGPVCKGLCEPCFNWRKRGRCEHGHLCKFCHLPHEKVDGRRMPRRDNIRKRSRAVRGM